METHTSRPRVCRMWFWLAPLPDPGAPFSHTTSRGTWICCVRARARDGGNQAGTRAGTQAGRPRGQLHAWNAQGITASSA
eukprot:366438-Chlamydomonas_euryale.AAC.7